MTKLQLHQASPNYGIDEIPVLALIMSIIHTYHFQSESFDQYMTGPTQGDYNWCDTRSDYNWYPSGSARLPWLLEIEAKLISQTPRIDNGRTS